MDFDLSNLNNYYTSMANRSVGNAKDISSLNDGKLSGKNDDELMDVCKTFEAYFIEQMFKEMKSTTSLFGEEGGDNTMLTEYFGDMTIAKVAEQTADNQSLGLAKMLYEQMKRNYDPITPEMAKAAAEAKAAEAVDPGTGKDKTDTEGVTDDETAVSATEAAAEM